MFLKRNRSTPFTNGYLGQMMQGNPYDLQWNQKNWRQSPYPAPVQQNYNWYAYQQQNPYYPQQYQPLNPAYQQGYAEQPFAYQKQPYSQKDAQFLFQNPLQPQEEYYSTPNQYAPMNGYPNANPYPKQSFQPKQPGGMQSVMNSFKSQDGSVDFNKMMNTAGQMMTAVNQVSSLVKGLGGFFKA